MSDSLRACAPAPPTVFASVDPGTGIDPGHAVMSNKLWDVGQYLKYHFLDGTQNQQNAVKTAIATWLTFTNIHLDYDSNPANADIRITFDSKGGSWSAVGTDAKLTDKSKATMNLGWVADNATPSATDLSTCLHELGHALGMMHEHQSPARGERIHLKELAVYNYYRPLLGYDDKLVKSQIIDQYNLSTVSNYSELDLKSIMMYFMPGTLNEEGIDVPPNLVLSDLDKAFITLNYPNKTVNDGGMKVTTALNIVGVPNDISAKILDLVNKENYTDARTAFSAWNMSVSHLHSVNKSFLRTVNPAEAPQAQQGLRDAFGKVLKHPMFKSVVKNVVNGVLQQQGIDTAQSVPGTAPRDTMNTIGAMVINPDFAKVVFDINNQLLPYKPHIFGPGPVQNSAISEKSTLNQGVNFDTTCLFREGLEAARNAGKL